MLITNGIEEKNVTKGVYKQIYAPLGYKPIIVIDAQPIEEKTMEVKPIEKIEKEIEKKPVSKLKTPKKSKK